MQKNEIFSFCSGSFSNYKKNIKYEKVRKQEKIRGIKRKEENINKYTKIIPLAHFEEVHYYRY